jgi:DNA-binding NarL/FixJ family response regulator
MIVDDHALFRETVAERLDTEPGITVVGSTDAVSEAESMAVYKRPHVILLDVDLGRTNGFTVAAAIRAVREDVGLIMLSAFVYDRFIEQALHMNVGGFVGKNAGIESLVTAIREVAAGRQYYSSEVLDRLVIGDCEPDGTPLPKTRCETLTPRELEILGQVAKGSAKKQIAIDLQLSIHTIEKHCENMMSKLGIHDRVLLARFAYREGFASL